MPGQPSQEDVPWGSRRVRGRRGCAPFQLTILCTSSAAPASRFTPSMCLALSRPDKCDRELPICRKAVLSCRGFTL
ncbi:hypothetical protein BD310DRAFT_916098 [Dichomitus squalens]|uniref:Uncharacterized protein n=1 Tax=Dichomitus squalens TaxID=114155 RepID=A0A4V2K9H5_9APHY|nr:hypothetical protein BD310DRAFT_916098 [Dichomitus squalens]